MAQRWAEFFVTVHAYAKHVFNGSECIPKIRISSLASRSERSAVFELYAFAIKTIFRLLMISQQVGTNSPRMSISQCFVLWRKDDFFFYLAVTGRFCRTLSTSFYISELWLRDWFELAVKFFHKIGSYVEYGWLPRTQVQCTFSMFWYVLWLSVRSPCSGMYCG